LNQTGSERAPRLTFLVDAKAISLAATLVLAAVACNGGSSGEDGRETSAGSAGSSSSGMAGNPGAGASTATAGAGSIERGKPLSCAPNEADVGSPLIRRLSKNEYQNTLRELFPGLSLPAITITADKVVDGFNNNQATQTATAPLVDAYHANAKAVATVVEANAASVAGCDASEATCGATFARAFAARAFRRPLQQDEEQAFTNFMNDQVTALGFAKAVSSFVEGTLQSANFLYRPEFGVADPSRPADLRLTGFEVANRLSYFVGQTMPDAALMAAASAGTLDTPAGLEQEARRLLETPAARAALSDFHEQWLDLTPIKTMARDPVLFPAFDMTLPEQLFDATQRFVMDNFWNGDGTVNSLLTTPKAYVNDAVAPLYGLPKPGSTELRLVDLDPTKRAGLLTQAGLMASMAHQQFDAPILRGVFVLRHLLCAPPAPPPPGVADIPPAQQGDMPRTTRQRVEEQHVTSPACKACHAQIDPLGFAFGNYDAVGQYRTEENGLPIDATGSLARVGDASGDFDGAIQLSEILAESVTVQQCAARNLFRFSVGRSETTGDQCAILGALDRSKGNLRELVVQLVLSDNFRYRKPLAAK
jgi:Protein of unknown function (DUF1592)/Protein of unknown function (DUF1588)/Protein of unknown function (DUF1595)/Protein of unknown function (DUF1587)/Protein of unknown function (DUF1585)